MARSFTAASTQYMSTPTAVVATMPMTMACWFNPNNVTGALSLMCVSDTGSIEAYYLLIARGGDAGDPVTAQQGDDFASYLASTSTSYTAGAWHHACAVFAATNSRSAYLNGGGKVTNTTVAATNNTLLDTTAIGALTRSTVAVPHEGLLAEAGLWNVALTDAEVAVLAAGYSPLFVRPSGLVAYWPLIGQTSPEIDVKGGKGMTLVAAPPAAAHCRAIWTMAAETPEDYAAVVAAAVAYQAAIRSQSGQSDWLRKWVA